MSMSAEQTLPRQLEDCEKEPIHIPGAIQPHGVLLVLDRATLHVRQLAGDTSAFLGVEQQDCLDRPLDVTLGPDGRDLVAARLRLPPTSDYIGTVMTPAGMQLNMLLHVQPGLAIVELEATSTQANREDDLVSLQSAVDGFERAHNMRDLCRRAAQEFRRITQFNRVMIYRFGNDSTGTVIAEDSDGRLPSLLNHHFPSSDIPRQARQLYMRNRVRVIPNADYHPMPLVPGDICPITNVPLDMSDCILRSVSPIHLEYMKNMDTMASMSAALIRDGALWGMVIGHHQTARPIPIRMRATCRILAGLLSQQIAARQDAEDYEEQLQLRSREDALLYAVAAAPSTTGGLEDNLPLLRDMLPADGIAVRLGDRILLNGRTPPQEMVASLIDWLADGRIAEGFVSHHLAEEYAAAAAQADTASGLLALSLPGGAASDMILWFRSERVAVINWAGNPHKATDASGRLNPRKSFDLWQETVRQQSAPWSIQEEDAARRVTANLGKLRN